MATATATKVADAAEQAAADTRAATRKVVDEFESATARAREVNEQILSGMKKQSLSVIDAYESTLNSVLDFQKKMADASQLEWVTALTDAHVDFVTSVAGAYTSAAREMLK